MKIVAFVKSPNFLAFMGYHNFRPMMLRVRIQMRFLSFFD